MGRVWDFLNQDANAAMDRLLKPYVEFVLSHRILIYTLNAAILGAFIWKLVSRTGALVFLAIWAVLMIPVVAVELKKRRAGGDDQAVPPT
jgi:hypothetical protein